MSYDITKVEEKYQLTIDLIVDQHSKVDEIQGKKVYTTVASALSSIEDGAGNIFIAKGIYYEKLEITSPSVTLVGEDRDQTILTYDVASGTKKDDGSTYGTFESASVIVKQANFTAYHLTFANGFDYMAEYTKNENDETRMKNVQAVAFRTAEASNHTKIIGCRFKGYQDTLLVDKGTHYFKDCMIEGAVDFIFGAGQAVFEECDIISLDRGESFNNGYITAASTSIHTPYGYLFEACHLLKESATMKNETVYLGRPWHPGGDPDAQASVLFYRCNMDGHIKREAWTEMGGFSPMDARLYEYQNQGEGSAVNENRRELPENEADAFRHYLRERCIK
ncbi:pectinesterase family protein [Gracilibacillus sp. S3-1-1]|uniref:Pectinesterase family protein n=1 Tax=Gracilibacillus pellucidus TaxID=3095368 RepID=A0ACC6M450_9BACI|nr:pectinesterase family protein [Gracilibacillus sp. S3-1-1]MDX8045748.1 pectinesterase family protein [Gracilibacillus sp. S3-1-1]